MRRQLAALAAGFLLCAPHLAGRATAQTGGPVTFTWGEEYELPKRHQDLGFLGNARDGYVQIGHRPHESLTFQKFSPALKLTGEQEADLSEMPRDYSSEYLAQIGDKYYWFIATYDRGDDKESLFAQEIDLEKGGMKGSAREILSTSKITGFYTGLGFSRAGFSNKWNFYTSFDKSKILVEYRKKPERRSDSRNKDIIGLQVFDANLNKLWGREIRMPYTEQMMDNEDYQVDRQGNVYALAKVYIDEKARDRKRPNYRFEILKWSADKPEVTKIPFRFTDRFVNEATLTEDALGNIVVAGYYSDKKGAGSAPVIGIGGFYSGAARSGSVDGAFILKVDAQTNEMSNVMKGTYEFSANVLKQYESRRARKRIDKKDDDDNAEADNLLLRKVLLNSDGSIELYGEEYYSITTRMTTMSAGGGMSSSSSTTTYYYNDILGMKIGADGNLQWMAKIPKSQYGSSYRGGMSFKQYSFNGNSYLFFMDNHKNLDIAKDEAPASHKDGSGGILMASRIDEKGEMTKGELFDVREEKVNLTVTDFDEVGNNQLIVRGRAKRRESKAALITFN